MKAVGVVFEDGNYRIEVDKYQWIIRRFVPPSKEGKEGHWVQEGYFPYLWMACQWLAQHVFIGEVEPPTALQDLDRAWERSLDIAKAISENVHSALSA